METKVLNINIQVRSINFKTASPVLLLVQSRINSNLLNQIKRKLKINVLLLITYKNLIVF